jgi:hypothetical protein
LKMRLTAAAMLSEVKRSWAANLSCMLAVSQQRIELEKASWGWHHAEAVPASDQRWQRRSSNSKPSATGSSDSWRSTWPPAASMGHLLHQTWYSKQVPRM